jgi:hypothetical protein
MKRNKREKKSLKKMKKKQGEVELNERCSFLM